MATLYNLMGFVDKSGSQKRVLFSMPDLRRFFRIRATERIVEPSEESAAGQIRIVEAPGDAANGSTRPCTFDAVAESAAQPIAAGWHQAEGACAFKTLRASETLADTTVSCHSNGSLQLLMASDARWMSIRAGDAFSRSVATHAIVLCLVWLMTVWARDYTVLQQVHLVDFELAHYVSTPVVAPSADSSSSALQQPLISASKSDAAKSKLKLFDITSAKGSASQPLSMDPSGKRTHSIHVEEQSTVSNRIADPWHDRRAKRIESPVPDRFALGKADLYSRVCASAEDSGALAISQTTDPMQTTEPLRTENAPDMTVQPLVTAPRSAPEPAKLVSAPTSTPTNMVEDMDSGAAEVGSQMVADNGQFASIVDETGDPRMGLESGWTYGQPDLAESSATAAAAPLVNGPGAESLLRLTMSSAMQHPVFTGGDPAMVKRLNSFWSGGGGRRIFAGGQIAVPGRVYAVRFDVEFATPYAPSPVRDGRVRTDIIDNF